MATITSTSTHTQTAIIDHETGYITNIDAIRAKEYPQLTQTTYLDHAGTTLYAKSLIQEYTSDLTSNLFGNPHSASSSSQLSSSRIDDARLQVLRFFKADPAEFDVVFVANATAGIKLVADALRGCDGGFEYRYHSDAHTSLVGVRELASRGSMCMENDGQVEAWLRDVKSERMVEDEGTTLFAYPAQSNMTGRRLPLNWTNQITNIRQSSGKQIYTLLDAAALVSTSPLDLSDPSTCPDFTALSFYKIFGFPDLGALIVRKSLGEILRQRQYFGGGTVDAVATSGKDPWHAKKASLHSALEDGTVAFHSIVALQTAINVHKRIYGSMENVSRHTTYLASSLREQLRELGHANGGQVCTMYDHGPAESHNLGPVIGFNLTDRRGRYVPNSEVEKLAIVKNIQFRTGGLCNPGGIASHLGVSRDDLRRGYDLGQRCGGTQDLLNGRLTGAIRLSLGAMSSKGDVDTFVDFIKEFYIDSRTVQPILGRPSTQPKFVVESLSVFPIKSCAAYKIPANVAWGVGAKGLAWDREWCLVHQGTNIALSQKRYPRMALIRPEIDTQRNVLRIASTAAEVSFPRVLEISLSAEANRTERIKTCRPAIVCGEDVDVHVYTSPNVVDFFSTALGVPCTLARFPSNGTVRQVNVRVPGKQHGRQATETGKSIALSNESPILLISRSSVNRLNEQIKQNGSGVGRAVTADSFRGNIVIVEELQGGQQESPFAEEEWQALRIGGGSENEFKVLGPCQRCQMVCVDQKSAQRRPEPFSTLAKTRRRDGRVWFGMHMCLTSENIAHGVSCSQQRVSIMVGDTVVPL